MTCSAIQAAIATVFECGWSLATQNTPETVRNAARGKLMRTTQPRGGIQRSTLGMSRMPTRFSGRTVSIACFLKILLLAGVWFCSTKDGSAQDVLHPWQNFHPPIPIQSFYWYRCPYGFRGPHDRPCQPANGVGPPPLIIPPCCGFHPITGEPILYTWHLYARSPRDYFMLTPIR
jgi:hypothetical protein